MGGSGVLTVWSADDLAVAAGLKPGDRLLGFDIGEGMQLGHPGKFQKLLLRESFSQPSNLRVLVERPAAGTASRQSALKMQRLVSRRSTSQTDFFVRQQRGREKNSMLSGAMLPSLRLNTQHDDRISSQSCATTGLFTLMQTV
eukprot:gnl/TRDRNA2_/TRDRNA2_94801_c0_seq1.p1 gnl/TRDRNA2_/TRDRNA2_94801_c0~~gnl/TRDRNA2_/TRDRNA2_94801_c0_seq1.p1  ORF type:complete len:143 (+),score=4.42 gnl/TRDRNA2_/TRDRNA2_94801_c0_seq1:213-641(+)